MVVLLLEVSLFPDGSRRWWWDVGTSCDVDIIALVRALGLAVVEVAEVGDNDRHWQGDGEYASNSTQGAHNFATYGFRVHITIAHSCHADHSPPEGRGDAAEVCLFVISFSKIHCAREEDDSNEEKEDQQAKLPHAGLESLAEDLQAFGVPGELEDPEDPHQPNDPENGQGHRRLAHALLTSHFCAQGNKIRDDGHKIDHVHDVLEEGWLTWAGQKPH